VSAGAEAVAARREDGHDTRHCRWPPRRGAVAVEIGDRDAVGPLPRDDV
jgi:hypothetical protein